MSGIVVFAGEVTLEKAIWDNVWGQYIFLKLSQKSGDKQSPNPFKKFTKRRKGKVGTRFGAVFTSSDGSIFYQDEVMLKNWADGSSGWTLHLWINSDDGGLHPFMNVDNKSVFALAMVELDDDNSVIDQDKRERVESAPKTARKRTLSNYAATLCREPMFMRYLGDTYGLCCEPAFANEVATNWMRKFLKIESRAELDTDAFAVARFHSEIRRPYKAWFDSLGAKT